MVMSKDDSIGPVVRVKSTLTFDDYRFVCRNWRLQWPYRHPWVWSVFCLFTLALMVFMTVNFAVEFPDRAWGSFCCLSFFVLWLVLPPLANRWSRNDHNIRALWQAAGVQESTIVTFAPSGIHVSGKSFEQALEWKQIINAETVGQMVILVMRPWTKTAQGICVNLPIGLAKGLILPERDFDNETDRRVFQQFAEALARKCRL